MFCEKIEKNFRFIENNKGNTSGFKVNLLANQIE